MKINIGSIRSLHEPSQACRTTFQTLVAAMFFGAGSIAPTAGLGGPIAIAFIQRAPRFPVVQAADSNSKDRAQRLAAANAYLAHIYSVYLGLRSCTEMSTEQNDQSFLSSVSLEQARKAMKAIDAASAEVGIDSNATWAAAAPRAEITAEALKTDPAKYLRFCQRMGSLFRIDQSNLQALLQTLGAKTALIQKDY